MKQSPLFSVIVPIYNSERFLTECLDSILAQTELDFELILVNDGSTDGSGAICCAYRESDARIKLVEISNSGAAVARNVGIQQARGRYLLFCDSDDYWEKNLLETLRPYALDGQYDVLHFGHAVERYERGRHIASHTRGVPNDFTIFQNEWKKWFRYYWNSDIGKLPVWDKAFRREIILDHQIAFSEQKVLEDFDFVVQSWTVAQQIGVLHQILYHFRFSAEYAGLVKRKEPDILGDTEKALERFADFLNRFEIKREDAPELDQFFCESYLNVIKCLKLNRADGSCTVQVVNRIFASKHFRLHQVYCMGRRMKGLRLVCKIGWKRLIERYVKYAF